MVRGKVVVFALGVVLLGVGLRLWLDRGSAPSRVKGSRPPTQVAKAAPERRQEAPPPLTARQAPSKREELEALSKGRWGRNPFLTMEEEAALLGRAGQPAIRPTGFPPLEVKAILVSKGKRIAMIDGHVVTEGDLIWRERVLEILPHAVVLGRGSHTRMIEMQLPSVPVRSTPAPASPR